MSVGVLRGISYPLSYNISMGWNRGEAADRWKVKCANKPSLGSCADKSRITDTGGRKYSEVSPRFCPPGETALLMLVIRGEQKQSDDPSDVISHYIIDGTLGTNRAVRLDELSVYKGSRIRMERRSGT